MSETHFSCDTVSRELWLAILSSQLCSEMDSNTRSHRRLSKVVFILTDFKSALSFLTSISESTVILRLEKVEFFKYINLRNILSIGFVKYGSRPTHTNFVLVLVLLDCRLRLLEYFF